MQQSSGNRLRVGRRQPQDQQARARVAAYRHERGEVQVMADHHPALGPRLLQNLLVPGVHGQDIRDPHDIPTVLP
ncbi:MAG: hypothetical protein KatS3mg131_1968 [Candidatus Tectimicrobiota bacterium]|nr:MAG: hypothetical protein KatS3mg131_1968 [Candidatus Tectomicrobia bacterium]